MNTVHTSQIGQNVFVVPVGLMAFVNHCCSPNCGIKVNETGAHDYVAMQDIVVGEEITFDYEMQIFSLIISQVNACVELKTVVAKLVVGRICYKIKESSIKVLSRLIYSNYTLKTLFKKFYLMARGKSRYDVFLIIHKEGIHEN